LPLDDDEAALAWARSLLQHYHGDAAALWPLAAWQTGRRQGVSALHGVSLDGLRSTAAGLGVRLSGVAPWWSCVLRLAGQQHARLRTEAARLLVVEATHVTALGLDGGRLATIELRRLDDATTTALARWNAAQPERFTFALGYGLRGGAAEGVDMPLPLSGDGPANTWMAS